MIEPKKKSIDYPDLSISSDDPSTGWCNLKKKISDFICILNSSVAITLLTLINVFSMSRYFEQFEKNQITKELLFLSLMSGLIFSVIVSGNLSLYKGIPYTQLFYLTYLIKIYGFESLSLICISLSFILLVFMGLKIHKIYLLIPKSCVIGMQIVMTIFLVMQYYFQTEPNKKLPFVLNLQGYFDYFDIHIEEYKVADSLQFVLITIIGVILLKKFKNFPFFFFLGLIGISFGFFYDQFKTLRGLENLHFNSLSEFLVNRVKSNFESFDQFKNIISFQFLMHMIVYSLLVMFEFCCTLNLLRYNRMERGNSQTEILGLVINNIFCAIFGLLPITAGIDMNMQLSSIKANNKFGYFVTLIVLILYNFVFIKLFKYFPLILVISSVSALVIYSNRFTDWLFLSKLSFKSLLLPILVFILSIFYEIFIAFFISILIFWLFYFNFRDIHMSYQLETVDEYLKRRDNLNHQDFLNQMKQEETPQEDEDETQPFFKKESYFDQLRQISNGKDAIIYTFKGKMNFVVQQLHRQNILYTQKSKIILDFKDIFRVDSDFLSQYSKLIIQLEDDGLQVYVTGIPLDYFKDSKSLINEGWIKHLYRQKRILFYKDEVNKVEIF